MESVLGIMVFASQTVIFDTRDVMLEEKVSTVENSTDFQGHLVAKPRATNYVCVINFK